MSKIKKEQIISLDNLPLKQTGIIETLSSSSPIRRRLLDLGIIKGTKIQSILISPSGDPTAYDIRGCLIALRNEDSKNIFIKKDKEL